MFTMNSVGRNLAAITIVALALVVSQARAAAPPGYVDASTFGYNPTDATDALQAAINTGSNVYVPNMGTDWVIRPIQFTRSYQDILFESGVVVSAKPGEFLGPTDSLFLASRIYGVTMTGYGATLRMRKDDYQQAPYEKAEWRSAISLYSVSGFEVRGLRIENTGGDAIFITATAAPNGDNGPAYSENVVIKDVVLDNNYRQGISVASVENLLIDNAIIRNTNGTYPYSGIDFEPDYPVHRIANAMVRNSIIEANNGWGILFATTNTQLSKSIAVENVTIVGNHLDGIRMTEPLPGVTIKDSLIVGNDDYGFRGTPVTLDLLLSGTARNSIDYSALWGNGDGTRTGWTELGPGTTTNVAPNFYSTDPNSPYYLYLAKNNAASILQGGHDGGYLGARPVVPEPAGLGMLAGAALLFTRRRRA